LLELKPNATIAIIIFQSYAVLPDMIEEKKKETIMVATTAMTADMILLFFIANLPNKTYII
jgi:hypothetical protein